jgi:hypothetical protein
MIYMNSISSKTIGGVLIAFSSVGFFLGIAAITGMVDKKYVWGGRLTTTSQLLVFEASTLAVNLFIVWLIGMRVGYWKSVLSVKTIKIIFIVLSVLMTLNTLGNLAAKTAFEKTMAVPTLVSAIGFVVLAKRKN